MKWEECSDPDLLRAIGRKEAGAFEVLYDRFSRVVFSTAYRVLRDVQGAEDVVQDVFVRLWRNPDRYVEERGSFVGWVLSVTRNRAIDEVRARRRRPLNESQLRGADESSSVIADAPSEAAAVALATAELTDQRALVQRALAEIPAEQRRAIELAYYHGLTQAEIAKALQTPLGTVKTRIRLGMQKLRVSLEGRVGPGKPEGASAAVVGKRASEAGGQ